MFFTNLYTVKIKILINVFVVPIMVKGFALNIQYISFLITCIMKIILENTYIFYHGNFTKMCFFKKYFLADQVCSRNNLLIFNLSIFSVKIKILSSFEKRRKNKKIKK